MASASGASDSAFDFRPSFQIDISGATLRPIFCDVRTAAENFTAPITAKHRAGGNVNRRQIHADGAHQKCGRRFVATAHQNATVGRIGAQELLGFHREEIAVHHGGGFLKCFAERERGHLDWKTASLPDAALDIFGSFTQMAVAGIDVAPGVDNRDDGLSSVVGLDAAHRSSAGTVAERAQVIGAIPAVTAERVGIFSRHRYVAALRDCSRAEYF